MNAPALKTYAFVLAVHDLEATSRYFVDALGFAREWAVGNDWHSLVRGGMRVMVGHCPDAPAVSALGDHSYFAYLDVDDVDALHAEFVARGAIVRAPPQDKPWGRREMAVATPEGHRMMFGESIEAGFATLPQ